MRSFIINEPRHGCLEEIPAPVPAEGEVLVEVRAAGLCGTDIHIYNGEYFGGYPRIPGHEFSGVVAALGPKASKFPVGARVSADPNIFCESCGACKANRQNFCAEMEAVGVTRHGAFAQFLTVPERCVFDIGDMPFSEAALLEPLSCVVYGQEQTGVPLGCDALIFGAGPIGLLHAQLAAVNGAASVTVVDLYEHKLALARELGVSRAYLAAEFAGMKQKGYSLVIDCTGVPAVVENAVRYVADAGTLLMFGVCPQGGAIKVDPYEVFRRELRLMGTFALKKVFGKALALAKSGKIKLDRLIDKPLALEEAPEFFKNISRAGNSGMKALFYPNQGSANN
ncbi:MAG: zinc-dependent alcohol dehydrogenase family protein [Clostridiales bacterium]|jgi:2-desacetyl-2-hydroxyethyl bacteriochlorophyllide A dehydrogenase|nr:zinc-dependent alcohol dehydrogenase family protein [Clostridiales bacterium]